MASFHGILIAASRAVLELGRVSYAPAALGKIHPKTNTPIAALLANMVIGILALLTGKTSEIILIAVFGALTLYVLSSAAVLQLRRSEPTLARPYRTPGYPVTPIVAMLLSLVCLGAMVYSYPWVALVYAAILVASGVAFVLFVPPERHTRF